MKKIEIIDKSFVANDPIFDEIVSSDEIYNLKVTPNSLNNSELNYEIKVPSLSSVLKNIIIEYEVELEFTTNNILAVTGGTFEDESFISNSVFMSLSYFPFHQCVSSFDYQINDHSIHHSLNNNELHNFLRFVRIDKARKMTPTAQFYFANNSESSGAYCSPLLSHYDRSKNHIGNGSFEIKFMNPENDTELIGNGTYTYNGITVDIFNGEPVGGQVTPDKPIRIKFKVFERINPLNPFDFVNDLNMFSIKKINLNIKLKNNVFDSLMFSNRFPNLDINSNNIVNNVIKITRINKATLHCKFVKPFEKIKIPLICYRKILNYNTLITNIHNSNLIPGGSDNFQTNIISLNEIPTHFLIYVTPNLPTRHCTDNAYNLGIDKLNFIHNSKSGILESLDVSQLYEISRDNRSELTFSEFQGDLIVQFGKSQGVGSIILLRTKKDLPIFTSEFRNVRCDFSIVLRIRNPSSNAFPVGLPNSNAPRTITSFNINVVAIKKGFLKINSKDLKTETIYNLKNYTDIKFKKSMDLQYSTIL